MITKTAQLGTNWTNPFQFIEFWLNENIVYQSGLLLAVTSVSTTDNKRKYYKILEAVDYVFNNILGINLANYHNLSIMVFVLTSTQEASRSFIHLEMHQFSRNGV